MCGKLAIVASKNSILNGSCKCGVREINSNHNRDASECFLL